MTGFAGGGATYIAYYIKLENLTLLRPLVGRRTNNDSRTSLISILLSDYQETYILFRRLKVPKPLS
jgi:hypothetical protein